MIIDIKEKLFDILIMTRVRSKKSGDFLKNPIDIFKMQDYIIKMLINFLFKEAL